MEAFRCTKGLSTGALNTLQTCTFGKRITIIAVTIIWIFIPFFPVQAESFPGLYSKDDLIAVDDFFEKMINYIKDESIKPVMHGKDLEVYTGIEFNFPISGDPIGFSSRGMTVKLPILSLTFLQDLIVAYLWEDINHCAPQVFTYLKILKYRNAQSLPGGQFPNPIDALNIPSPNTGTLAKMNVSFGPRLQRLMYGALLFITAHEVGHIVLNHRGSNIENEIAADDFALNILARNQIDPSGAMVFFMLSSVFLPTEVELQAAHLTATHPLNGKRIRAASERLSQHPEQYFGTADPSDPRVKLLAAYATNLTEMAKHIDELSHHEKVKEVAFHTQLSELRECQAQP